MEVGWKDVRIWNSREERNDETEENKEIKGKQGKELEKGWKKVSEGLERKGNDKGGKDG